MLNLNFVKHKFFRLVGGYRDIGDIAERQWDLSPQKVSTAPAAIYLDETLDRIKAVAFGTTYEFETLRIQGGEREHMPTRAFLLKDAVVINGHIYKKEFKLPLINRREALWLHEEYETFSQAALACTWCGNQFFGNWMRDDLPLGLVAQDLAKSVTVRRQSFSHEGEYRNLFAVHSHPIQNAKFSELIVIDDVGQNESRKQRYEKMRSHLNYLDGASDQCPGVFIRRGNSGAKRRLVNQEQVEDFLQSFGFKIIDQESLTAKEIVSQIRGAKIIIGVEGSHLAHSLYTIKDGGCFLVLQHPERFGNVYKDYADCLGMSYAFVVGSLLEDGFSIDLNELGNILDKVYKVLEKNVL